MILKPPQQKRSRETLDRILDATERLLQDKEFESISIAEIVLAAEASTGAFYARFPTKEALLPALYERLTEQVRANRQIASDPDIWGERTLEHRVHMIGERIVREMRAARHVMRPLALYARRSPEAISPEDRKVRGDIHRLAAAALLECRDEIGHPDPALAADFVIYAMSAVARDKILFGDAPHASSVSIDDDTLARELIQMSLAYLRNPK